MLAIHTRGRYTARVAQARRSDSDRILYAEDQGTMFGRVRLGHSTRITQVVTAIRPRGRPCVDPIGGRFDINDAPARPMRPARPSILNLCIGTHVVRFKDLAETCSPLQIVRS